MWFTTLNKTKNLYILFYIVIGDNMKKIKKIIFAIFICLIFLFTIIFLFEDGALEVFSNINLIESKKNNEVYKNIINKIIDLNTISYKSENTISEEKYSYVESPIYYLYNSHQGEEYGVDVYTFKPTVLSLSYMIDDELKKKRIPGLVEERDVLKEVREANEDYPYTYDVTRRYMEEVTKKYPTIKYLFDIHRDGLSKELSTATIEGKSYAKIMFLSGENHENYEKNLKNIKIMEKYILENYPAVLRNTYHQKKYNYNQTFSEFTFLIEVGGQYNTIEEIYNTSIIIAEAIEYLIEETNEK